MLALYTYKQQISVKKKHLIESKKKTTFNSNTFTKMDWSFINTLEFNLFIVFIALPHNKKRKKFNKIEKEYLTIFESLI